MYECFIYMHVYHVYECCSTTVEEGTGSPGTELKRDGVSCHMDAGNQT